MTPPDERDTRRPKDSDQPPLSPRLREKLGAAADDDDDLDFLKKKSDPGGLIITAIVAIAVVGGGWWLYHNGQVKAKAEAAKAAAVAAAQRATEVADSLAVVAHADSVAAQARADSITFAALPKWKQRQILAQKAKAAAAAAAAAGGTTAPAAGTPAPAAASTDSAAAPAEPVEQGPFGIDAGQFIDQAQANTMVETLKAKTGLAAQLVTEGEGDAASYHVMLGHFSTRAGAEAKATSLLGKGLVDQASVTPLPKAK